MIFFRGQQLTEDQQIRFARRFGELEINVNTEYGLREYPEMLLVSNVVENGRHIGLADAGITWHTDMSAYSRPPRCSLLYAKEIPYDSKGEVLGDTLFTSAAAAYDGAGLYAAATDLKAKLFGARATNSSYLAQDARAEKAVGSTPHREACVRHSDKTPPVAHPTLPHASVTGRKCLYVHEGDATANGTGRHEPRRRRR